MEKIKTISIITICYNCKEALSKTMDSVKAQDFFDKEFIVIDGGSTDGSLDVLKQETAHIDYWQSERDNGIYDAINKGISHATGEWIICMNAGDIFADSKVLSNIYSSIIPENISVLYSDYWAKTKDGLLNLCHMNRSKGKVMHQAFIYKRRLHEKYGLYLVTQPYICSDLQFMLMIPEKEYLKIPIIIAVTNYGGVSQNSTWCDECSLGLKVAFRIESINKAFLQFQLAKLKKLMPYKLKTLLKKHLLRQVYSK